MYIIYIVISLIADWPHHYHPAYTGVTTDLPISPRFTPYDFLSRCKFSDLITRQPMVEFLLTHVTALLSVNASTNITNITSRIDRIY